MKKRHRQKNTSDYQPLEHRTMFAGISIEVVNNLDTLVIDGSTADDTAVVRELNDGSIEVDLTGNVTSVETFSRSEFERIRFLGREGNDTFINQTDIDSAAFGHSGNDELRGGNGHNWIQGGSGDDEIYGGSRNDLLRGRDGDDFIDAGQRHDRVFAGDGMDLILGGAGRDFVRGEAGNDTIWGGNGEDRLSGGEGNNTIRFGAGATDVALYDHAFSQGDILIEGETQFTVQTPNGEDLIEDASSFRFSNQSVDANSIVNLTAIEQETLRLVNQSRSENGLAALTITRDLSNYADRRAENVLAPLGANPTVQELFDAHSSLNDIQPLLNGQRTLYLENHSFLTSQDFTPEEAAARIHDAFLNSPTHRANIMHSSANEIGLGIFKNSNGWYVVQNFAQASS